MEDYNEKINYGTEDEPLWRNRLFVTTAMYGYFLYDRKIKQPLLSMKPRADCDKGKELLLAGKIDEFNKLVEDIKDVEVVDPKIIKFKGKHTDDYYYINTYEQLKKVSLNVLQERLDSWYLTKWSVPDQLDYNIDDIQNMPESFRKDAENKLAKRKMEIKEAVDNNKMYESAVKALDENNGGLAWTILQNRNEYEYESFEIITPINL